MSKKKLYRITNFEQLFNAATEENVYRLLHDFSLCMVKNLHVVTELKKRHPVMENKVNNEILPINGIIWTDDGKHDFLGFELTNPSNGEITKLKPKNKRR